MQKIKVENYILKLTNKFVIPLHYHLFVAFFLFSIFLQSCTKINTTEKVNNSQIITADFFHSDKPLTAGITSIVEKLRSVNEHSNFIKDLPANCGLPIWDKLLVQKQSKINDNTNFREFSNYTSAAGEGSDIIIVPLTITNTSLSSILVAQIVNDSIALFSCRTANNYLYNLVQSNPIDTSYSMKELAFFFFMENKTYGTITFHNIPATLFTKVQAVDQNGNRDVTIESFEPTIIDSAGIPIVTSFAMSYIQHDEPGIGHVPILWGSSWLYPNGWGGGNPPTGGGGGGNPPPVGGGGCPFYNPNCNSTTPSVFNNIANPINTAQTPFVSMNGIDISLIPTTTSPIPVRQIAHTPNRGNTEDMTYGTDGDTYGILSNMPYFTNASLFSEMTSLFHACTFFNGNLKTVGDDMIQKFQDNQGGQYTNPLLNSEVLTSPEFKTFMSSTFGGELKRRINQANGNINNVANIEILGNAARLKFNGLYNKFHGLQILINDTEYTEIDIYDYHYNSVTHAWDAEVTVTIHDHFGLDKNDALTYQNNHVGFAAWWLLQHTRNFKPMETIIKLNIKLSYNPANDLE